MIKIQNNSVEETSQKNSQSKKAGSEDNKIFNSLSFSTHMIEKDWKQAVMLINEHFSISVINKGDDSFWCSFVYPCGETEEIAENMTAEEVSMLLNGFFADEAENNNTFNVGDVLYSSWGWEQTNIDYYQVIKTTPKFVIIRELKKKKIENHAYLSGIVFPLVGQFEDDKTYRRKINDGKINVNEYENASIWDGKPKNYSSYA